MKKIKLKVVILVDVVVDESVTVDDLKKSIARPSIGFRLAPGKLENVWVNAPVVSEVGEGE